MKIYLSFKITYSCVYGSRLSRTSDGWFYSQTDSTSYEGPYISSNTLMVNEEDKTLIKDLVATKKPKNTSEHDWVYNSEENVESISYSDCGLCSLLNNIVNGKYPIEFVPSDELQPYELISVLLGSAFEESKEIETSTPSFSQILEMAELAFDTQNSRTAIDVCESLLKIKDPHYLEKLDLILVVSAQAVSSTNTETALAVCQALVERYCSFKCDKNK